MANHTVPVLKKAISVLRAIAQQRGSTTKSLAHSLEISPSTTYRILQTFLEEDWVRALPGGQYELSLGLMPVLQPLVRHEMLAELVRSPLNKLTRETGLTSKLSVQQGEYAVTIMRAESTRPTSVGVSIGAAYHLALGSSGAVLLSGLEPKQRTRIISQAPDECWALQTPADVSARLRELAEKGACTDSGKYRQHLWAMAAPVLDQKQAVVGAITVIGFADDFEGERKELLRRTLIATARTCHDALKGNALETADRA